jgi:hypothetical protein
VASRKEFSLGKARRGDKERSREQELKYENQKLRREVSSLRKQLARIDLDRYSHVRDMVEEHLAQEEEVTSTEDMLKSMKNEWKCHECNQGHLEIFLYTKIGETWYFRQCNACPNRTKSQIYTPSVKGIIKQPDPEPEKRSFKKK